MKNLLMSMLAGSLLGFLWWSHLGLGSFKQWLEITCAVGALLLIGNLTVSWWFVLWRCWKGQDRSVHGEQMRQPRWPLCGPDTDVRATAQSSGKGHTPSDPVGSDTGRRT